MKKVAWRGDESVWRNFGVARTWNAFWEKFSVYVLKGAISGTHLTCLCNNMF